MDVVTALKSTQKRGDGTIPWRWIALAVVAFVGVYTLAVNIVTSSLTTASSSPPDPIRDAARRIGTDCRMTIRAPAGQTSQDAIDAFAALRNKDEAGLRALMAGGRVALIPEGSTARVLDAKYHGNIAIKVRVLSGGQVGREVWVFEGICK